MSDGNQDWRARTALLIGETQVEKLSQTHVLLVGLGGVGAYTAEQLCRAGIGEMTLVDADTISVSNLNRQLPALHSTIGKSKVEVIADRMCDINPSIKLHIVKEFIRDERTTALLEAAHYDYVIDAIDSISPKVYLIAQAIQHQLKVVSVMGAGGKTDPTKIQITDISKSCQCHLAQNVRKRLHKMGITTGVTVVFSTEHVPESAVTLTEDAGLNKLSTVGTISYMTAIFGCYAAAAVIRYLLDL